MTSLTGSPCLPNSTVACPAFGANRTTHASVEQIPIRLLSFDIHSSLDRDRPVAPGLSTWKTAVRPAKAPLVGEQRSDVAGNRRGRVCSCHGAAANEAYARERSARKGLSCGGLFVLSISK